MKVLTNLEHQLRASSVVTPRWLILFKRTGQLLFLLGIAGLILAIVIFAFYLAHNWWDYYERDCTQRYRRSVRDNVLSQLGADDFPFLTFVYGKQPAIPSSQDCSSYARIDGMQGAKLSGLL